MAVAEKTVLAFPGSKPVPIPIEPKRALQVARSVAATAGAMHGSAFLQTPAMVRDAFLAQTRLILTHGVNGSWGAQL